MRVLHSKLNDLVAFYESCQISSKGIKKLIHFLPKSKPMCYLMKIYRKFQLNHYPPNFMDYEYVQKTYSHRLKNTSQGGLS